MACDTDGVLDNGESGYLSFRIYNTGSKDVQNGTVTITTPTGGSVTVNGPADGHAEPAADSAVFVESGPGQSRDGRGAEHRPGAV